jgi:hypothetical protein
LKLSDEEIINLLDSLEKDSKALREEAIQICWYMRGSVSYDDSMLLTAEDRKIISKLIKDNLETTKKTGMPFF